MVCRLVVSILFLLSSIHAMAIDAVVAHTLFYIHDSAHAGKLTPCIDAYWEINPHTIHYATTPEKTIVGRVKAHLIFSNSNGTVKEDEFILQTLPATNVKDLGTHRIIDLRRYFMEAGTTFMKFTLKDMADSTNKYTYSDSFIIAPVTDTTFYSGLQLLDTTIGSQAKTVFLKNGKQQIPICTNFLDEPKHTLNYYGELYKSGRIPASEYPLVQKVSIIKREDDLPIGNFIKTDTITPNGLYTFSGSFDIRYLASGNYLLSVSLANNSHEAIASGSLFFQRLNTHPLIDTLKKAKAANDTGIENVKVLNLNKTFVAKYNLAQVRGILKMLLPFSDYAATQTINGFLKKPDDLYSRYYIYNYFAAINKNDPTKAWKEFSEKIIEVNKLYTARGTPGYETDRGFIYLRYGAPSEVITVESEQGALPYEIWQYNTLTQLNRKEITDAKFLFYKRNETDDYQLLHSTVSVRCRIQAGGASYTLPRRAAITATRAQSSIWVNRYNRSTIPNLFGE